MKRRCFSTLLCCLLTAVGLEAAVFQYRVMEPGKKRERPVFCWIPPTAERLHGVLYSAQTLMEKDMSTDPRIRAACAEAGLAIVLSRAGMGGPEAIQRRLAAFAEQSGYRELARAPIVFVGHSANGPQAKARAIDFGDRCIGLMQYRGGAPTAGADPTERPGLGPGVPALMMVGQFDEFGGDMRLPDGTEPAWERGVEALARFRRADPANLGSILVEAGAGHFPWSERSATYFALFLAKIAAARIPAAWPLDSAEPVVCHPLDPATGWLSDLRLDDPEAHPAAPYEAYAGDPAAAAWHIDEELARASVAMHEGLRTKQDQFIEWKNPYWVDAGTRYFFTSLAWVDDGATFQVRPVYAERYPEQHKGQGPRWPRAGEPVGHSEAPIKVRPISGPLVAVADDKLAIRFSNVAPVGERHRSTFLAYSRGDDTYRYTEHVGMMPRGFKGLKKGTAQTITFPELADRPASAGPEQLAATSDAGLPVQYYVAVGPAVVEDGVLRLTGIPPRAGFPIDVEVVAWQFGSGVEPLVKTADPVVRRFRITGP